MESKSNTIAAYGLLGLFIAVGLTLCGYFIFEGISHFRAWERAVTVKGLAEKEVKSNLGIWTIQFKTVGNDLEKTYSQNEIDKTKITAFLQEQGFTKGEIRVGGLQVNDLFAREYVTSNTPPEYRYILNGSVTVNTADVDKIQQAIVSSSDLVKSGVLIQDLNYVRYIYTDLNELRPELLAQATRSARELAEQFAQDSGSKVGGIKKANQGVFKILAKDSGENSMGIEDTMSLYKKIRVVSTIDYFLE